jgi:hypothetical protein
MYVSNEPHSHSHRLTNYAFMRTHKLMTDWIQKSKIYEGFGS